MWFQKISILPHAKSSEISRGGALKAKLLEEKYEAKLECPAGWKREGAKQKNLPWREYGFLLEVHI